MGFWAGGLTSRLSPSVSSAFGVDSILGLMFASFSYFSRPADTILNLEPGGGQGILAYSYSGAGLCVMYFIFYFGTLRYAFSARHSPPSPDCR